MTTEALISTIANAEWMEKNRNALLQLFPETWTHTANINFLAVRYSLKLLGVDFRSEEEFVYCLVKLDQAKVILRDGATLLRRGKP